MTQRRKLAAIPTLTNPLDQYATSIERRSLCDAWCAHISGGYSKESFTECHHTIVEAHSVKYPNDFPIKALQKAEAEGLLIWEKAGKAGVLGKLEHFSASAWTFTMRCRFGWREKSDKVLR